MATYKRVMLKLSGEVLGGESGQGMNKEALEKGAVRPAGVPDMSVKKVGVLGAGMMGAGIAFVSARAGIEVVLMDRDQEAVDRGFVTVEGLLDDGVKKRRITPEAKTEISLIWSTRRRENPAFECIVKELSVKEPSEADSPA